MLLPRRLVVPEPFFYGLSTRWPESLSNSSEGFLYSKMFARWRTMNLVKYFLPQWFWDNRLPPTWFGCFNIQISVQLSIVDFQRLPLSPVSLESICRFLHQLQDDSDFQILILHLGNSRLLVLVFVSQRTLSTIFSLWLTMVILVTFTSASRISSFSEYLHYVYWIVLLK